MKIKLNNPEQFCKLIKCPYHRKGDKLTSNFRCQCSRTRMTCEYLTSGGNPRMKCIDQLYKQNCRDPIVILAALMKCDHVSIDEASSKK
jgi:hypothetical protein